MFIMDRYARWRLVCRAAASSNKELKRFNRVVVNPPFCQNYIKIDLKLPCRFSVMMPEEGKKANLIFVSTCWPYTSTMTAQPTSCPVGAVSEW